MGRPTLSLALLLLFVGVSSSQAPDGAAVQGLTTSLGDFAARLYRSVSSQTDDNVLLCPLVVSSGIAALMAGAEGSTKQDLLQGLGLTGLDAQNVPALFQSLRDAVSGGGAVPLRQAVAVLPGAPSTVSPAYAALVAGPYSGTAQSLAYSSPDAARATVNGWAQSQTADAVRDMVQTPLDPQTKLLLASVASFQSSLPFNLSLTQDERFFVDKYHIKQVPMMFRSDKFHLAYDRTLKLGVLKLPMADGTAMLVLLPDENVDLSSVEEQITYEQVQGWLRQLKKTKLEVQFPRFQLEQSYDLGRILWKLGITEVFQDSADLSGIGGDATLKLTQVIQRAAINVDESGSAEGGAASVFSSLPPRLTVNRPFLFLVYHQQTSSILYMGRVVDPTRK